METRMGSISERGTIESRWIVFRILDRRFAIEAKIVKEILSIVPFNPSYLGGSGFFATFPLRGQLVYAFDLRYYWGEEPMPYNIEDNLLLLDNSIAFPIQEIIEIRDLDVPETYSDRTEPIHFIKKEIVENDIVVSLLDSESLLNISIEIQEHSESADTKQKMHWIEVTNSGYTDLDKEILTRRKLAYERVDSPLESASLVSLAVIESVEEKFCLPIEHILEFSEPGEITPIPGASSELHGCMNLRGEVVPVISLAALMGKNRKLSYTEGKIILVKVDSFPIGILVDELLDVVNRKTSDRILSNINSKFNTDTYTGSFIEASFPEPDGSHLNQLSLELIFNQAKLVLQL